MKRALIGAVVGLGLMAVPSVVQSQAAPTVILSQLPRGSLGGAVGATIQNWAIRNGYDPAYILGRTRTELFQNGGSSSNWGLLLGALYKSEPWLGAIKWMTGFPLTVPDGFRFRSSSSGNWLTAAAGHFDQVPIGYDDCDDFVLDRSPAKEIMVPTVPLGGGQPINYLDNTFRAEADGYFRDFDHADSRDAIALWVTHHMNVGRPPESWCGGLQWSNSAAFLVGCPATVDVAGRIQPYNTRIISLQFNGLHWDLYGQPGGSEDCPGDGGGGSFDFYSMHRGNVSNPFRHQDGCTFYGKNFSLSPSGYAYPTRIAVPGSEVTRAVQNNPEFALCQLHPQLIKALAQFLIDGAARRLNDPSLMTASLVANSDIAYTSDLPLFGANLAFENPGLAFPAQPVVASTVPPPAFAQPPTYVEPNPPSNTGGNGAGGSGSSPNPGQGTGDGVAIDLSHPEVAEGTFESPDLEMPNYFPDIGDLLMPVSSGQCPTFQFNAYEANFVMDSHCGFIADNRVLISSIMIVVFTMAAGLIVLRA